MGQYTHASQKIECGRWLCLDGTVCKKQKNKPDVVQSRKLKDAIASLPHPTTIIKYRHFTWHSRSKIVVAVLHMRWMTTGHNYARYELDCDENI